MHYSTSTTLSVLALAATQITAVAIPAENVERGAYPFNRLVAFGDELSDNGNGSFAHGITGGTPASNVYGFGTWTNGPVAVSYLADLLGVPLTDYAFGAGPGGGSGGATISNSYAPAAAQWNGKPVPSVHQQITSNYTKHGASNIKSSLQFIWIGENDLSDKTDAFWEGDPKNAEFATQIAERITSNAELLVEHGAPAVLVANIYPKNKAPVTPAYLCRDGSCIEPWGNVIEAANAAIKASLAKSKYSSKFIYYDVYGYMLDLMKNKDAFGLTASLNVYCDGNTTSPLDQWDKCAAGSYVWEGAEKYFWMTFIQPTTHVHRLIAADMKKTIDQHFGQ